MPPSSTSSRAPSASLWRGAARRDQLFAVVVGVILLTGAALLNAHLNSIRASWNLVREDPESDKTLQALAVTFPRLTLGGMRGIVSTYLWQQAEEDKNDRKWLDLETKYDMIGALQPYFSSVYIFHSWNQAYNLSAQWQEEDTKYKWVLDGLAYLYKGEEYNPNNTDIYLEEAHLYFLKLGGAAERIFYREHWRNDIARLHELNGVTELRDDATIALKHVRDIVNRPYFHAAELPNPDPARRGSNTGWGLAITAPELFKDRSDNKKATDPVDFPYGLSPYYFGYVEYERCLANKTPPTYTAERVVDAWPAMCLRLWCRDDLYYTYTTMKRLFGKDADLSTYSPAELANLLANKTDDLNLCFRNVQMIGPRAIDAFNVHDGLYPPDKNTHTKHIMETQTYLEISKAENALFNTLVKWQLNDRKMVLPNGQDLRTQFQEADNLYKAAYPVTMAWVDYMYPVVAGQPVNPDRADSEQYATGLLNRSRGIEALISLQANEKPDMSFLDSEVVER